MQETIRTRDEVSFGPFRLAPAERLLEKTGVAVPLGGRALDILILLLERAGEVVSKRDLIGRVWPDVTVDEGSLRVHVSVLRKALGDGESGARYVTNVPGRGYCFVAEVSREKRPEPTAPEPRISAQPHNLPARLMRMIGRDETIRTISARLAADRFITIVGPGGIGKTTLAVSVGHEAIAAYGGPVHFIELGALRDIRFVVDAIAAALGLRVDSNDSIHSLVDFLRDKRMLLILDSCEHVIDGAAAAAESIFLEAPHIHILATSREPLRVEGEHVHRLFPLDYPPDDPTLSAAEACDFPAVRLFVERVAASGTDFTLTDADAPRAADICRRLDGIPLAIEIAAGRVQAYGIDEVASQLNDRFRLSWRGKRTALPRHQTLSDTLDWSHNLLSDTEQVILRRLSIFVGFFSLEAGQSVASGEGVDRSQVIEAVEGFVAKSLLSTAASGKEIHYRLFDTTLAYLRLKLIESREAESIARRHAIYYRDLVASLKGHLPASTETEGNAAFAEHIRNVRSAVEWSFSQHGDVSIGISLVVTWAPILLAMSLVAESSEWARRSIAWLNDTSRGTQIEMGLQTLLGMSLMFIPGPTEEGLAALTRALEIAEGLGDSYNRSLLLTHLYAYATVTMGDYRAAHKYAQRCAKSEEELNSTAFRRADSRLTVTCLFIGDLESAEMHGRAALKRASSPQAIQGPYDDLRIDVLVNMLCVLWLRGYVDQAIDIGRSVLPEVANLRYPFVAVQFLAGMIPFLLCIGDDALSDRYISCMLEMAKAQNLSNFRLQALAFKGALSVRRGAAEEGISVLRDALDVLPNAPFRMASSWLVAALAEGLAGTGRHDEAITLIGGEIARIDRDGDLVFLPNILRAKADILASMRDPNILCAEDCLLRSLELARQQSALSWELRAATSLARLRLEQGRTEDGRNALASVYGRFTEGFGTHDLIAAKRLLDELG